MKIYKCKKCDNMVAYLNKAACDVMCCGEAMEELVPNTSDGAGEKHVPVVTVEENKVIVNVGEVEHPMMPEHYIEWIAIETKNGRQRKVLSPSDKPFAEFYICDGEKVEAVYEYCNIHGLWKKEL